MARPTPPPARELNFYGLDRIGYADSIPLTGDYTRDQLAIESICFRVGLRHEEGGLGAPRHFRNYINLLWGNPDLDCNKRYIPNPWSDQMLDEMVENAELGIAGSTSAGKSDPAAMYAVARYSIDPSHTMILVLSTTIPGAKKRIWKSMREYWEAIPGLPGKPLWSTNEIQGTSYDGKGYGQSSGIYLLASEQSNEKSAMDKLIGIKAPRTGTAGRTFEELIADPEYADLAHKFDEEYLRDLLPRLQNLSQDRIGNIIMLLDEATGCAPSILNVIRSNLQPGNVGHFQVIMMANPHTHYDVFGAFCKPMNGWNSVSMDDDEWVTFTGGKVIRFNGEKNPRITQKNEKFSWMLRQEDIDLMKQTYGPDSLYVWRMCYGMFRPEGSESGIYSQADFAISGAEQKATWGYERPVILSSLDPSFTAGGDKAMASFGPIGKDPFGKQILELTEQVALKVDINDLRTPISHQLVRAWKKECRDRGILPHNAACDVTGAPSFGDIVKLEWSPQVLCISSGGKASRTPVGNEKTPDGKPVLCCDRYANKATEIWHGAMPFFRSQQLRGIPEDLAKQMVTRQYEKDRQADARVLKIEGKRIYKSRDGASPDESDSYLLLVELAKQRHGFKPTEKNEDPEAAAPQGTPTWKKFCERARRITTKKHLIQ